MTALKRTQQIDLNDDAKAQHQDVVRQEVLQVSGLIRDNGARLTAYMFARHNAETIEQTAVADAGIERCKEPLLLAFETLLGKGAVEGLNHDAVIWMRQKLRGDRACYDAVAALADYLKGFLKALDENELPSSHDLFASLFLVRDQFIDPFNTFLETLRDEIAADRQKRIENIQKSAARAKRGVEQISEIARTVRMVSINAQIEAARAGDKGRAFAIIAQEINALSDEISSVGGDVQSGILETLKNT